MTDPTKNSARPALLVKKSILALAAIGAIAKLNPLSLWRNPVIFATELAAAYVTLLFVASLFSAGEEAAFAGQIALWL